MLATVSHPHGAPLPMTTQLPHPPSLPQSPREIMTRTARGRDLTSPTTLGITSPLLPPRPQHPRMRRSFTIADLLGGNDDPQEPVDGSTNPTPPGGACEGTLSQLEAAAHLYDDQDRNDSFSPQDDNSEGCHGSPADPGSRFEWLQCTRYHPPKLPRVKRREGGQKRKLGRNPRVPFSSTQLAALEARFRQSQYLSSCDVADLSGLLNLTETRVKIWFQNRRARERRDREARAKGLPPSSSSSSIVGSSSCTGGPLPPSALALYQFTSALAPGSSSAFTPVLPRPLGEAPPTQLTDSTLDPPSHMEASRVAPPTPRGVPGFEPSPTRDMNTASPPSLSEDSTSASPKLREVPGLASPIRGDVTAAAAMPSASDVSASLLHLQQTQAVSSLSASP
ncbi:uncharacterized protein [Panulirus ornatus]